MCALPRGELAEGSREGTNESRGLRDNLWEGKSEVAICLDHRACCALLIPLQLSWSAHTLSIYRDKTPPELSTATHFNIQHGSLHSPEPQVIEHLDTADRNQLKRLLFPALSFSSEVQSVSSASFRVNVDQNGTPGFFLDVYSNKFLTPYELPEIPG